MTLEMGPDDDAVGVRGALGAPLLLPVWKM